MHTIRISFLSLAIIATCAVGIVSPAQASKPIVRTFDGCVVDGLLISASGYHYKLMRVRDGKTLALPPLEGKRISMRGLLHVGDYFVPDLPSLRKRGRCGKLLSEPKFIKARAWANRTIARNLHRLKRYDDALKRIEIALRLRPNEMSFHLTKGRITLYQGDKVRARQSARHALKLAKDDTERKWCHQLLRRIDPIKR